MRALYTTAPGVYGLAERPAPTIGPGEALVKVAYAAICHTDVLIRAGIAPHVRYPCIPGHEFSGTVVQLGPTVKHIGEGQAVAVHTILSCGECTPCRKGETSSCLNYDELGSKADGGFAELVRVPARHLYPLPASVSLAEAALAEPLANAVSAVRLAEVAFGDVVVVIGPGPIGLLAMQVARLAHPTKVVLVGTRAARLAVGQRLGATHTVNLSAPGASESLRAAVGERGADVVLDCAGAPDALTLAQELVGLRGRIVIEGLHDPTELATIRPYDLFLAKAASLRGIAGWITADFVRALDLLAAGLVDARPLLTHTFPLEEWEAAFDMVTARKDEALKVLLQP